MKKIIFLYMITLIFTVSVHAETVGQQSQTGPGIMTGQGQQMCPKMQQMSEGGMTEGGHQMMQMGPMMGQMMGHRMMARDMM